MSIILCCIPNIKALGFVDSLKVFSVKMWLYLDMQRNETFEQLLNRFSYKDHSSALANATRRLIG